MMRLSTMWNVDRTGDDEDRSPIAEAVARPWAPDPGWPRFFRASANFVFVMERGGERCFLRFADATERDRGAVEAEVELVSWLAEAGLPVARPLPSGRGSLVESIEADGRAFHTVVFAGLTGEIREIEELDGTGFGVWGAALGRLHAALRRYPGDTGRRPTGRDQLRWLDTHLGDDPAVRAEFALVAGALAELPADPATAGLVHGDFELDNLVWRGDTVSALDFDDAAHAWHAADVAFALRDLFPNGFDAAHPSLHAFAAGYRAHHAIGQDQLATIPIFLRQAKLMTYARIRRALDLPSAGDHPTWLTDLDARLRARNESYAASLSI